ncbi:outer membrane beta-barrel protein [Enterovirga rhinocerotis]|uniref:Outer membrane beta-barrel protein n=1 Tax=Enterovirga rhinocerotis TaxID=1339210 RepID=A0A4R7BVX0_9HYPH|nr:outer membrane beta-barrel protein [Enterovirga rhinocerotis]TDR88086.1 hypothetical protein EV668_3953 [Enterovirga rhinocerotis]
MRGATPGQLPGGAGAAGTDPVAAGLLRPGLSGPADEGTAAPPVSTTTGSAARQALRPPRTRRSGSPVSSPVRGPFRATIAPPEVAPDVQPLQTGVPDPSVTPPPRRRPAAIDDPYAPLGLRVGSVTLTPILGQSFGYDSNPNRTQVNQNASAVSRTELELGVRSDWSRHELSGNLRGAYNEFFSNKEANRPEGSGELRLRLDATRDTQIEIEGRYLIDTQRPGSPDLNASVVRRPVVYSEGGTVGVTHRFNRLVASLRGTIDRYDYENAKLTNGTTLDQSDRAMTAYGLRGRLGYEIHPGLIPFVEAFVDTRRYDRKIDNSGYARSSDGTGIRAGTSFEITRKLTAEVSAGVSTRSYEDQRLGTLTSPIVDASLIYSMTPLTTIRANVASLVDETAVPGANGIRVTRGSLEVAHDLRRNVTLTAGLRASDAAYQGANIDEQLWGAYLRADWRLNRQVALRASYAYDNLRSSSPGASYVSNVFLLGVRLTP